MILCVILLQLCNTQIFLPIYLEQRVRDIQFLRQELGRKLEEVLEEIDALVGFKTRVERALEACSAPLRVTLLCLEER